MAPWLRRVFQLCVARSQAGEQRQSGQLCAETEHHQPVQRHWIKQADDHAATKPGDAVGGSEQAVGRGAALRVNAQRQGGRNDGLVHTHAQAPQRHAEPGPHRPGEKHQRREQRTGHGERQQQAGADAIEPAAQQQRTTARHRHRQGIGLGNPCAGQGIVSMQVVGQKRIVGEAGGHQAGCHQVQPEAAPMATQTPPPLAT